MNDRRLAQVLFSRALTGAEFLIALVATSAVAAVAGTISASPSIATDPVSASLVSSVPRIIFAALVLAGPLLVVHQAAADRAAGWTAPVFAGRGSAVTYVLALVGSIGLAAGSVLASTTIAFHAVAGRLDTATLMQLLTGMMSLFVLCAYAAVLWVLAYESSRALLAMLLLWIGPIALAFYLVIGKGMDGQAVWLRMLVGLVPPVRQSTEIGHALIQAAYAAFLTGLLVMLAPKRVPVWR